MFLSFHGMLFSRLQVSPEVTVLSEVSPRLLFNVHAWLSIWLYAGDENLVSLICVEKDMKLLNIIDRGRRLEDLDLLLYFHKPETRKCCNEIFRVTN